MEYTVKQIFEIVDKLAGEYLVFQSKERHLKYLYHTKGISRMLGFAEEELHQFANPMEFIFEEDKLLIQNFLKEDHLSDCNQDREILFRMVHKVNGFIWVHMSMCEYTTTDGDIVWIANIVDVSKETQISYALMESSERYICVIEKKTKRILYANSKFYDLIDSNPKEAIGKHCYELLCKTLEMKDNDNCLCYSSLHAKEPIETYNEMKKKLLTITGKEVVWGGYESCVFYLTDITEQKAQQQELENSNQRFEMALDNSDLMVWEYDIVNSRCIISQKASTGYALPTIIDKYPESLYETGHTPPETIEQIKEVKQRLLNGESGFSVERRTINKDGQSEWQKVEYTLMCDASGKPERAIVCGMDITRQKELEQKYVEQVEYRNRFTRNALFSIRMDITENAILDYSCANEQLENILNRAEKADQVLDNFFGDTDYPEDNEISELDFSLQGLNKVFELGHGQYKIIEGWNKRLERYLTVNLYLDKNPASKHLEVFFIATDVTENVLKQKSLENVANKDYDFVSLIDCESGMYGMMASSVEAVLPELPEKWTMNHDKTIVDFAKSHRSSYQTEEDYYAVSEGMRLHVIIEKLAQMEVYEFTCKTNTERGMETYRMRFTYMDENKKYIIYSRTNITKAVQAELKFQQNLEEALRAAKDANFAKTDFLARMSHDIRTPMNAIIGLTALSLDEEGLSKQLKENLTNIRRSGDFLLGLVNDILDMSKIESGAVKLKNEPYYYEDFLEKIKAMFEPQCKEKGITFDFEDVTVSTCIQTDCLRMDQIFFNIFSNAVKYTPEGGKISYYTENLQHDAETISADYIIEDNGIGMSDEFLRRLFLPFEQEDKEYSANLKGSGLGLSIAKNLVELMGGSIHVESKENVGTKVIVHLGFKLCPNQNKKNLVDKGDKVKEKNNLSGKWILLAEDHPLNAQIATKLLEKKEMKVVHAENGQKAIDYFLAAKEHTYGAILMDIRMPVLDGLDATRKIRALDRTDAKTIPIIAMSANAYDEDVQKSMDVGMNVHLAKPVEPQVLYHTLEELIK